MTAIVKSAFVKLFIEIEYKYIAVLSFAFNGNELAVLQFQIIVMQCTNARH